MQDAYWIPRQDRRDQELQRPVLYAPSPYEMPDRPPEHESEAEAEADEQSRVVIIEI
jgi:hypothetical protein